VSAVIVFYRFRPWRAGSAEVILYPHPDPALPLEGPFFDFLRRQVGGGVLQKHEGVALGICQRV
jgi:hypothetical protein